MSRKLAKRIILIILMSVCASKLNADKGDMPPNINSLIKNLAAARNQEGGIVIVSILYLPKDTKLTVKLFKAGQKSALGESTANVDAQGYFQSQPFYNAGLPYDPGPYEVVLISYFTADWQSKGVLAQVGANGKSLPQKLLVPDDKQHPNAGGHLEEKRKVTFPPISAETNILKIVKTAKITLEGKGKSSVTIEEAANLLEKSGEIKVLDWSAVKNENGTWVVILKVMEGGKKNQAEWKYNPKNKSIKYMDTLSKRISYVPPK
jgi:hypothetical protein